jgi:hypothetical protein
MLCHRYLIEISSSKTGNWHISGHLSLNISMGNSQDVDWLRWIHSVTPYTTWFHPPWPSSVVICQKDIMDQTKWMICLICAIQIIDAVVSLTAQVLKNAWTDRILVWRLPHRKGVHVKDTDITKIFGEFLHFPPQTACMYLHWEWSYSFFFISCVHFGYFVCRCHQNAQWPVSIPVTSPHCFLSLGSLSTGPSMKSSDCLLRSVAVQCLECFSPRQSLILSLPTNDETTTADLGPWNKPPSLRKASASLLLWIPLWPGIQGCITLFWLDKIHVAHWHSQISFNITIM